MSKRDEYAGGTIRLYVNPDPATDTAYEEPAWRVQRPNGWWKGGRGRFLYEALTDDQGTEYVFVSETTERAVQDRKNLLRLTGDIEE